MIPERPTVLVVAADAWTRQALRGALEPAGYRVIPADEEDAEAVIQGILLDAVVVHGDDALVSRMAERAGTIPWIAVEEPTTAPLVVGALLAAAAGEADCECWTN
jgi:hypothetical protein